MYGSGGNARDGEPKVNANILGPILVVDDDAGIRELISETLADEGYEVLAVPNGLAALKALDDCEPSLILLDLLMPLMDGDEFLHRYRERPGPHAPVVVFSASGLNRGNRVSRRLAADAFLPKPFDLEDLLALVNRFVPIPAG